MSDDRPWRIFHVRARERVSNTHWRAATREQAARDAESYVPWPLEAEIENAGAGERYRRTRPGRWERLPDRPREPLRSPQHAVDNANYWWRREDL